MNFTSLGVFTNYITAKSIIKIYKNINQQKRVYCINLLPNSENRWFSAALY
jgi:hypothetical protein